LNFNVGLKATERIGPSFITLGNFILITSLYSAIEFHNLPQAEIFFALLRVIGLGTVVALQAALALLMHMTERSVLFSNSYLKNEPWLRKVDRKFYKSCRPFVVKLGLLAINRHTFIFIMNDFIVFSVINLLIAFR
jgi:hypothetical protein